MNVNARLYCTSNKYHIDIINNPFTIGRGVSCDYIIPNQVISRLHCQIEKSGNEWFLRDKSTNGTFLNNVLIKSTVSPPLKDADVIQLSEDNYKYIFQYECNSKDDISDEQLCIIADSVLENLVPITDTSNSIVDISDTVAFDNVGNSVTCLSTVNDLQPNKRIKVTSRLTSNSVIDLTDETPSTSDTNQPSIIDLSESFASSSTFDPNMVIQNLSDIRDQSKIPSTSTNAVMGQVEFQSVEQKESNGEMEESREEFLCAICSEMFIKATTLNCSHTFCKFCIDTWKKKQKCCPICRKKITSQVGTLVLDNYIEKIIENCTLDVRENRKKLLEDRKISESTQKKNKEPESFFHPDNMSDTTDSLEDDDDDLNSEWHDDWSYRTPYYGGYGNCFVCGRRGHWATGCPFR